MEHPKYQLIAIIAGLLTIVAFSHLVYKVYLTKHTEHITFVWISLVLTAQTLLIIYGKLNNSYGIYLPAILIVVGLSYILYIKLTYNNTTQIRIENELKHKNII